MPVAAPAVVRLPSFIHDLDRELVASPGLDEVLDSLEYTLRFEDVPLSPIHGRPGWFGHRVRAPLAAGGVGCFLVVFKKSAVTEPHWNTPPFTVTLAGLKPVSP